MAILFAILCDRKRERKDPVKESFIIGRKELIKLITVGTVEMSWGEG